MTPLIPGLLLGAGAAGAIAFFFAQRKAAAETVPPGYGPNYGPGYGPGPGTAHGPPTPGGSTSRPRAPTPGGGRGAPGQAVPDWQKALGAVSAALPALERLLPKEKQYADLPSAEKRSKDSEAELDRQMKAYLAAKKLEAESWDGNVETPEGYYSDYAEASEADLRYMKATGQISDEDYAREMARFGGSSFEYGQDREWESDEVYGDWYEGLFDDWGEGVGEEWSGSESDYDYDAYDDAGYDESTGEYDSKAAEEEIFG